MLSSIDVSNGGTIFLESQIVELKSPKTYEEQVEILRNRGCAITDDVVAVEFLKRTNYYRFTGYLVIVVIISG